MDSQQIGLQPIPFDSSSSGESSDVLFIQIGQLLQLLELLYIMVQETPPSHNLTCQVSFAMVSDVGGKRVCTQLSWQRSNCNKKHTTVTASTPAVERYHLHRDTVTSHYCQDYT